MTQQRFHGEAHAKINLTLEIVDKLPNGYHLLRSVMMQLPHLYDDVDITFSSIKNEIVITCTDPTVPIDNKNICHKIAQKFFERTGKCVGMTIDLVKRIPAASGMGGGSSDGAQVLHALNDHFDHVLSQKDMIDVAASVGKDIPFFLSHKECALIEGMGEIITKEIDRPNEQILVVNPGIAVSTPMAFGALARHLWFMTDGTRMDRSRAMVSVLCDGGAIAPYVYNDFETAIFTMHPEIAEIKHVMLAFGAQGALMTGSGSTVFGIFTSEKMLRDAQQKIMQQYPQYYVTIG